MKRKIYESPLTLRTEVELESEFMGKASVFVDKEDSEALTIENQKKVEKDFDFSNNTWD